ncbi:MAG: hypothetical protein K2X99_11815 [Gemmatimonadaceae bacterium]|nr:hypothetical protein [Gemmatimonadaceae bacterium]
MRRALGWLAACAGITLGAQTSAPPLTELLQQQTYDWDLGSLPVIETRGGRKLREAVAALVGASGWRQRTDDSSAYVFAIQRRVIIQYELVPATAGRVTSTPSPKCDATRGTCQQTWTSSEPSGNPVLRPVEVDQFVFTIHRRHDGARVSWRVNEALEDPQKVILKQITTLLAFGAR